MKKGKKLLVTASLVSAAVTMGGCRFLPWANSNAAVYGPPPGGYDDIPPTVTTEVELHQPEKEAEETQTHPMEWYDLMFGRYAVVRIISVPEVNQEEGKPTDDIVCGVEVLSWYDWVGNDFETVTELTIWRKDIPLFSEGDVIFAGLMSSKSADGLCHCWLEQGLDGRIYTPFVENRLVLTDTFQQEPLYRWLSGYNEQIEKYRSAIEEGEAFYMEFDFRTFEEGMTTEETALFFEDLRKAKTDYEMFLEEHSCLSFL